MFIWEIAKMKYIIRLYILSENAVKPLSLDMGI